MSREVGERCVEIARQVRDGEYHQQLGKKITEFESNCLNCGCPTIATQYEHGTDGCYCGPCHQEISSAIYEHEAGLLRSGYYGS